MSRVTLEKKNHIAIVTFNRPEKLNALDDDQIKAILEIGDTLKQDKSIRAVVLTGAGKAFCAGLDVQAQFSAIGTVAVENVIHRTDGILNDWQKLVWQWHALPVPVIAAVHGYAFGGGLQIMMGCDIRIVAPETKLAILETKWGIVPDMAGTQLFRHSVRADIIKLLTYTHRTFSGKEALEYGFATQLSETPLESAIALAEEIASKSPDAIVQSKKILNAAPYVDAEEGLMQESVAQSKLLKSKNQMEAVMAGIQKRSGNFDDYSIL